MKKKLMSLVLALAMLASLILTAAAEAPAPEANPAEAVPEETAPAEAAPAPVNTAPALILRTENLHADLTGRVVTQPLALDDFSVMLALDTSEDLRLVAAAYQADAPLAMAVAQLSGDRLQIALDGVSKTYEAEIAQLAEVDTSALPELVRAMLPAMLGLQPPMIPAPAIPKLDLTDALLDYITDARVEGSGTVTSFTITETAVALLIAQWSDALKSGDQTDTTKQLAAILDSYPDSDLAFSVVGTITDTPDAQSCVFNIMVSAGGESAELPTAILRTNSVENQCALSLCLPTENDEFTIASLNLTSDPETNTLNLNLAALGALTGALALSQEGSMQYIDLDFSAQFLNQLLDLNVIYGQPDGLGLISVMGQTSGSGAFEFTTTGMPMGSDAYTGTLDIKVTQPASSLAVTGGYTQSLGALDLDFEMPAEVVPIQRLTADELAFALQPLTEYFASLTDAPAP